MQRVKIQVTTIFLMQDMRGSFPLKCLETCMETPYVGARSNILTVYYLPHHETKLWERDPRIVVVSGKT